MFTLSVFTPFLPLGWRKRQQNFLPKPLSACEAFSWPQDAVLWCGAFPFLCSNSKWWKRLPSCRILLKGTCFSWILKILLWLLTSPLQLYKIVRLKPIFSVPWPIHLWGGGVSYPRIWEQWHSLCMFSLVQLRTAAGAVNCLRWQCCDIHYLFLPPSGKALPAEVQCLLHNDHAPVPKARIWEVPHWFQ